DVRGTLRTVVAATETQPIGDLPVAEDLVGVAGTGRVIVRNTAADFQVELLDERDVGQDRDQQFAVDLAGVDVPEGVAARIDTERLVEERTTLSGQRIVEELVVHLTIASTDRGANRSGGQFEQAALEVGLNDRLAELRTVLQIRAHGFEAVLAEATGRRSEEVDTAGALASRCTEAAGLLVTLELEPSAEVRRAQQRASPHQRIDARLAREGV